MAMIHCRECGEKISDSAKACPKCGAGQKVKSQSNSTLTTLLAVVVIAVGGYFAYKMFMQKNSTTLNIPSGSYLLMKDNVKGLNEVLHVIDEAKVGAKGLGNQLIVMGDSIQASDLFTNIMGGPTKFAIKPGGGTNMFKLELPDNQLSMELTSQGRLRIYVGSSDSLVYQKQ